MMDDEEINTIKPAEYFAHPPYRAELYYRFNAGSDDSAIGKSLAKSYGRDTWEWLAGSVAGVMNRNGINVLCRFRKPWSPLTDFETAQKLAKRWNEEAESN